VTGAQALTGDGGLAMLRGYASLLVVDLGTGHVRWSRTAGNSSGPAAAGGDVVAAANAEPGSASGGRVMGYHAVTGRLLWTRTGMPEEPQLQTVDGRVVVYSGTQAYPVTALSPMTGRTLWRLSASAAGLSAGPAGLVVTTDDPHGLYLVDPVTGRVRWHVPAFADPSFTPLVTAADVVYVAGPPPGGPATGGRRLADLRAGDGSPRWSAPLAGMPFVPQPAVPFGRDFVVPQGSGLPGDPARLVAYRQSTGAVAWATRVRTLVQVPPAVAGADLLVQPTDPSVACPA
jgi:outer membrane protein assembly factor BamB